MASHLSPGRFEAVGSEPSKIPDNTVLVANAWACMKNAIKNKAVLQNLIIISDSP
jgi:hypothetical protein